MVKIRIHDDGAGKQMISLEDYPGVVLPVTAVAIQMAPGCFTTAQIDLAPVKLDLRWIEGEIYCFLGDRRFRLVDEDRFEVIARDGTQDHAFKDPEE
jgi:hypothetical protein